MYISTIYKVGFDPSKEYEACKKFEEDNPDWKVDKSTVLYTFTKEERYYAELYKKEDSE